MAKKSQIDGGFVVIPKRTLKCEKWKKLHLCSKVVFLTMLTELYRDKKSNPQCLVKITYSKMQDSSGLSKASVARGIKELKEEKIISVINPGGLERNPSEYSIDPRYLF